MRFTRALAPVTAVACLASGAAAASAWRVPASPGPADPTPWLRPVPKAQCGPKDRPESGLQGQTTAAERFGGAAERGFTCNLELVGQYAGEGASWQLAWVDDCGYYGTANGKDQQRKGVVAVDASDPVHPRPTAYLDAPAMLDPWESLKVNARRKLLAGVQARGPEFAVYDVADCRRPMLKSAGRSQAEQGHAGEFTPDGNTYYGTQILAGTYPIDLTDPAHPVFLSMWRPAELAGRPHDVSFSQDGRRMYLGQPGMLQKIGVSNGLVIVDVSDVQARRADPRFTVVSTLYWNDSAVTQTAVPIRIGGKPYLVVTDENGAGGYGTPSAACAQRLPPFGSARIVDIGDERNPRVVSKLMLEAHDPAHCDVLPSDPAYNIAPSAPGYSSHYCGFDDPDDAHLAACSHFEGGLRVFDIRDPARPKEIAYYKPPAVRTAARPGSWRGMAGADRTSDFVTSQVRFRKVNGDLHLWFTSHDNGFQIVKFTNQLASIGKTLSVP